MVLDRDRDLPQKKSGMAPAKKQLSEAKKQGMKEQQEQSSLCDFEALVSESGNQINTLFNKTPSLPYSQQCGGSPWGKEVDSKYMWFACVLWDCNVLKEFVLHEEMINKLYSTLSLGKLLSTCIQDENQSWPGINLMDWRRSFILLDIIDDSFRLCGSHLCLRVQETPTGNMGYSRIYSKPKVWDLVVFPECKSLANEMIRRFRDDAVKTTVMLWGAYRSAYPEPWIDGEYQIFGEILLRPQTNTDTLSVLIFHRESISEERCKLVQRCSEESELWRNFQDVSLPYKWFSNSQLTVDKHSIGHLSLHVVNYYEDITAFVSNENVQNTEADSNTAVATDSDSHVQIRSPERRLMDITEYDEDQEETILTGVRQEDDKTSNNNNNSRDSSSKRTPPQADLNAGERARGNRRNESTSRNPVEPISNANVTTNEVLKLKERKEQSSTQNVQETTTCEPDSQEYRFTEILDEL